MEESQKKLWESGRSLDINSGGNAQDPGYMPGPNPELAWIESPHSPPPFRFATLGDAYKEYCELKENTHRTVPWDEFVEWMNSKRHKRNQNE